MTTTLVDRDLEAVAGVLDDAGQDDPGELVPWAMLDGIDRLIGADNVQLTDIDLIHRCLVHQQFVEGRDRGVRFGPAGDDDQAYWRVAPNFLPCSYPIDTGDLRGVPRWSDFYSDRQLVEHRAYREYFRPIRHGVAVCLPTAPGRIQRVVLFRTGGADFSDRDVTILRLLRPHLHEIFVDAERRRRGIPKLTEREWEVLGLAGSGLSNLEIAVRLVISPGTVRKHMEHIFDQLGVRSRAAAAALALPHRPLLTGPGPAR
jgi:DNA-binding CsgD family transcriptional regulator